MGECCWRFQSIGFSWSAKSFETGVRRHSTVGAPVESAPAVAAKKEKA
jgi:hypothetical protein